MRKGDKLIITYGAGSAGVDVPENPDDYDFTIETVTRGGAEFGAEEPASVVNTSDDAERAKLLIEATELDGSGTATVDMDTVPVSQTGEPRRVTLRFTYKAAGNIDTLKFRRPGSWPTPFPDPSSDTSDGRITVSSGTLDDNDVGPTEITLNDLDLTVGNTVIVTYSNAATPTNAVPTEFIISSGGGTATTALPPVTVYVVSKDGSGKVADTPGDLNQISTTDVNEVFTTSWRAGAKARLDFFYNLGSNDYVRDGELKIIVPRSWTGPSGVDLAQSDVNDDTPAEDKPSVAVSGSTVTVAIKKMPSSQQLTITFKDMVAPAHRDMSRFRVSAKSTSGGRLSPIALNRSPSSTRATDVIVKVVDGASGSGQCDRDAQWRNPFGSAFG